MSGSVRVADVWVPDEFRVALQFQAQAFHTPFMCLWGGLIFACFVRHPWLQGIAFVGAAWFHLLLDACQTRYGNGVAFLYPASWHTYNFELFGPEDHIGLAFLAISTGVVLHSFWKGLPPLPLRRPSWRGALMLGGGFVLMPLITWHEALEANVFNMAFVYSPSTFEGKEIGFERNRLISSTPARLRTWYGRELVLDGVPDDAMPGDSVSLCGTYRAGTLEVERFHVHWPHRHTTPSLIALALLVLAICQAQSQAL
jgi:hypothetical protein